ncbi:UNVERIFIED_CONTAM: hypothetical protein PYX00_001538 [Menopon gallinae]|uniref:NF-X1-type domain-containing protein n=1 Tax=Menopon gallinae TaxID=328185 RepID=A0AAW2IFA5_9NEOP
MSCLPGVGRGENPWKQESLTQKMKQNGQISENNVNNTSDDRFRIVREEMLASVQKHLNNEYESSSDEEDIESEPILRSLLKDYSELNKTETGLEKTRQFLENSLQSDAGTCLICIATIKRIDPIWNCAKCFGFFHINCIQKWAKDSIFQRKQAEEDLPSFRKTYKITWPCPKCRNEYEKNNIPQRYFCFCGKVEDPTYQAFLIPHSCGERCDKLLKPECGHTCLLLCHPGPCPPCPKTVQTYCHCKKQGPKVQRCNNRDWSCGLKCGKPLLCKKHSCEALCHSDECPPCSKESVQSCNCGLQKKKMSCMSPEWQCNKVCGTPFSCGFHSCTVICHSGGCGDCPRSQKRACPCGKSEFQLPCTEDVPTCNETCGKSLECGVHFCSQKCHKGSCGTCLETVVKVCRCGQKKKEFLCQKEFLCASKCKRMKNCGRHPCNRKVLV